ncbi:hypothetical protein [Halothiobacillus sp.]|uniref:hypothetical protein n=1 Tax=Halothiobacillus sp. TaxID=1891311 RepID=UPI002AD3D54A|nr:hypothetical protein [Halothiobacillus sp.]
MNVPCDETKKQMLRIQAALKAKGIDWQIPENFAYISEEARALAVLLNAAVDESDLVMQMVESGLLESKYTTLSPVSPMGVLMIVTRADKSLFTARQSKLAKNPRGVRENIAKAELVDAMVRARRDGITFKAFMQQLENGSVTGLQASMDTQTRYQIDSDNSDKAYFAMYSTLERKLWTKADSPLTG